MKPRAGEKDGSHAEKMALRERMAGGRSVIRPPAGTNKELGSTNDGDESTASLNPAVRRAGEARDPERHH
jgi:hypothetical protein